MRTILSSLAVIAITSSLFADEPKSRPLFNGNDLTGWVNLNGAKNTFYAKNNEIITSGQPVALLRTDKQYENFILEAEWMHVEKTKMANSGIFIWADALPGLGSPFTSGIEVQVLINFKPADGWATSHGDLFSVQRATCKPDRPHPKGIARCLPSEERVKGAGEWNHYKITAKDGVVKLAVNGKEVSGLSECSPRKGYLMLESEGVECHFRNLKITELPSSNPKPELVAHESKGHVKLYDALSMDGWKGEGWSMNGGRFVCKGDANLSSLMPIEKGELLFDWKASAKGAQECVVEIGGKPMTMKLPPAGKPGSWTRATLQLDTLAVPSVVTFQGAPGLEIMNVYHAAKK
jgi:Domain of Unknown Function (DUF1080)